MVNLLRVFKKTAPNGKVTAYLTRRDFVDHISHTSPVDGVVVVDHDYLSDKKVFACVGVTYRYGREEDEMMGLHFSKEIELVKVEVLPRDDKGQEPSDTVQRLLTKLGDDARPFCLQLPKHAPTSVTLDPGPEGTSKKLGVTYEVTLYVAQDPKEDRSRHSAVVFPVRKVQFAPTKSVARQPFSLVCRTFTLSPGKLTLEVGLERDLCLHGQSLEAQVTINNSSKKTVKQLVAQVVQHVEVTVTNMYFSRVVAAVETHEGCPITPDTCFSKTIVLMPLPFRELGVALEGHVQDQDVNLASSTMMSSNTALTDVLGIIVSYSLRVKLNCGTLGGELRADLPFKLMHPDPANSKSTLQRTQSVVDDNFIFEEYSALRRGKSLTEELEE